MNHISFKKSSGYLAYLSIIFALLIYPILYVENYLWARFGGTRILAIMGILLVVIAIKKWKLLINSNKKLDVIVIYYTLANLCWLEFNGDLQLNNVMGLMTLLNCWILYFCSLTISSENCSTPKLVSIAFVIIIITYCLIVIMNSLDGDFNVHRVRYQTDNFNYLLVSYLLLACWAYNVNERGPFSLTDIVVLTSVAIAMLLLGGRFALISLGSISIFLLLKNLIHYKQYKMIFGVAVVLISIVTLSAISGHITNSMKNRYNIQIIESDKSLNTRISIIKQDILAANDCFDATPCKLNIVELMLGRKLISPDRVRKKYNHTFFEVILNYGIFFSGYFLFIAFKLLFFRGLSINNSLKLICFLSLLAESDIYIGWWIALGSMAGMGNQKASSE